LKKLRVADHGPPSAIARNRKFESMREEPNRCSLAFCAYLRCLGDVSWGMRDGGPASRF
jgi:hypothetical protein